jgi:hypothetical protein
MRSKKVEAAIKEDIDFQPIGKDFTGHPIEEFTNMGSSCFCPFIDNNKLAKVILSKKGEGIVHRDVPTRLPIDFDPTKCNPKNRTYHWVQIEFKPFQCCKFQRDPMLIDGEKRDLCQYDFKKCPIYKANAKNLK